jgi:hypothetical protein
MNRIILVVDISDRKENDNVDEYDLVSALRKVSENLIQSAQARTPETEMLIAGSDNVGEESEHIHFQFLAGSETVIVMISELISRGRVTSNLMQLGPDKIKEILESAGIRPIVDSSAENDAEQEDQGNEQE